MLLEGWGQAAQKRLKASRVLIAGGGGLATAAALYLAAAGVGAIRLVDDSKVTLADLSHPLLFRERDLGKARAVAAAEHLRQVNPFVLVESQVRKISAHSLPRLLADCTLILDSMNKPPGEVLLNRAAVKFRLPVVHARVRGMEGHLTTFWPGKGPCVSCAFPEAPSTADLSLFPPLPGIMGALQTSEALRLLSGQGPAWLGRVLIFKGDTFRFSENDVKINPECHLCGDLKA
jgi:adenylyltransferase/sulfurtransferase